MGPEGVMPLEIRFLHDPKATEGFVGCALFGKIFRFYKTKKGDWAAEKVRKCPWKLVHKMKIFLYFVLLNKIGFQ